MIRAYLFKPKRKRGGKVVAGKFWRLRFKRLGEARYQEICLGVTDRQVAEEKRRAFVKEREDEASGIIAPKGLREGAVKSMADHLTDFLAEKSAVKRDDKYVYNMRKRVGKLIEECAWVLPRDVTVESFESWRGLNATKAGKTLNDYLASASAVLNWMVRRGRLLANPLRGVERVEVLGESPWRALTVDEQGRLLSVAGGRKAVYLVALTTGLRRSELEALEWRDVRLDAVKPFLQVRAATTKNGKAAVMWLRDDVAAQLSALRPVIEDPSCRVFTGGVPSMEDFRADLAAAGIAEKDEQGHLVVFHSLRHTLATNLARTNESPRVAMELMRHSDMRLTMKVYTDAAQLPTADALDKLPRYDVPSSERAALAATGTDGRNDTKRRTKEHTIRGLFGAGRVQCGP